MKAQVRIFNKEIRINHSTIEKDFLEHLALRENNRILFTAPFGAGKSTFLQEAFHESKDYFTINLFPVNYSVSANEDVFEIIKFDLLLELLGKYKEEIDLEKEDFSALLLSQMFVLKELKLTPIIFAILKQCGKIGKSAVDIIEEVKKQYDDFKIKMTNDESDEISTFLNLIQDQKGSEHEMDSISTLIKNLVGRVKENKKGISSVLIIDDLDRLDPEHTFRLINIFSAHFDKIDNSNKFGFDKVIFVCDFENIRKIFHHKYGLEVDFSGYSDKFFSLLPYSFDNRQYIREKVDDILTKLEFDKPIADLKEDNRFSLTTKAIINSLVHAHILNLRMLFQYPGLKMDEHYFGNKETKLENILNYPIIVIFYLLKNFYGSFSILRLKLKFLSECLSYHDYNSSNHFYRSDSLNANNKLLTFCLPFLLPKELLFEDCGSEPGTFFVNKFNCTIHYMDHPYSNYINKEFVKATAGDDPRSKEVFLNPYKVLLDVFDTCQKLGAFK